MKVDERGVGGKEGVRKKREEEEETERRETDTGRKED